MKNLLNIQGVKTLSKENLQEITGGARQTSNYRVCVRFCRNGWKIPSGYNCRRVRECRR